MEQADGKAPRLLNSFELKQDHQCSWIVLKNSLGQSDATNLENTNKLSIPHRAPLFLALTAGCGQVWKKAAWYKPPRSVYLTTNGLHQELTSCQLIKSEILRALSHVEFPVQLN